MASEQALELAKSLARGLRIRDEEARPAARCRPEFCRGHARLFRRAESNAARFYCRTPIAGTPAIRSALRLEAARYGRDRDVRRNEGPL